MTGVSEEAAGKPSGWRDALDGWIYGLFTHRPFGGGMVPGCALVIVLLGVALSLAAPRVQRGRVHAQATLGLLSVQEDCR